MQNYIDVREILYKCPKFKGFHYYAPHERKTIKMSGNCYKSVRIACRKPVNLSENERDTYKSVREKPFNPSA